WPVGMLIESNWHASFIGHRLFFFRAPISWIWNGVGWHLPAAMSLWRALKTSRLTALGTALGERAGAGSGFHPLSLFRPQGSRESAHVFYCIAQIRVVFQFGGGPHPRPCQFEAPRFLLLFRSTFRHFEACGRVIAAIRGVHRNSHLRASAPGRAGVGAG